MEFLLDVVAPLVRNRRPGAPNGLAVLADGDMPRTGDQRQNSRTQGDRTASNNGSDSLGPVIIDITIRLAIVAGFVYTSVRVTQFLEKLKQREGQTVIRTFLRAKLPARVDIEMEKLRFNSFEMAVAQDVVASSDLETTFDMIGGLGDLKEEIMDIVTLACSREAQMQGVRAPRGILLSGVPGTGKTMLARAIAKESGATFINVRMGAVQQKWVGEGEKMVAAIFSLANKLAPSIIFIDEIDCFMRTRTSTEYDHVARVKTEFMTMWDGLLTERSRPVIVLGTTNRPLAIDPAILRRLPRQFVVGLPVTADQRKHILLLIARKYRLADDVDLALIAAQTAGFSGSDLDALFQAAQTVPAREFARALREDAREERSRAYEATAAAAADNTATPAGTLDPNDPLLDRIADLTRRTVDLTRRTLALMGTAQQPEDGRDDWDARTDLRMRGISQSDFHVALEQVRPTGEMAAAVATHIADAVNSIQRRHRAQEQ